MPELLKYSFIFVLLETEYDVSCYRVNNDKEINVLAKYQITRDVIAIECKNRK